MLSTYILRPFIREVRFLNVSACGQGKVRSVFAVDGNEVIEVTGRQTTSKRCFHKITLKNNNKMLQTFEEYVFRPVGGKRCIYSSMDYHDNSKKVTASADIIKESNGIVYEEQQQIAQEYEEAVKALNSLQSNAESLRSPLHLQKRLNSLQDTEKYLIRSGVTIQNLESLSFVHVAGTKGKGSTCAIVESILRSYGVKTGFFSSPHLVSLTERIRLNGLPISKKKFTQYFWPVFNTLKNLQEYENDMPAYFKFLTILCFHVYLKENVDVVILEVGIGGELDCTNVVPNTKTVGITSLGLEHTQLLGNTLREIAWQKAGIIKPGSMVYTSANQPECLEVLKQRAQEKNATLHIVPDFLTYFEDKEEHQKLKQHINNVTLLNGSLAIQLAYDWLRQNRNGFCKNYKINSPFLSEQAIMGLSNCNWPGRCQVVNFFNLNMHLDGAHTVESMRVCGDWFAKVSHLSPNPKILIFNTTGDRDSRKLLTVLRTFSHFDLVCFVPNISVTSSANRSDTLSVLSTKVEQLKRVQMHSHNWEDMCRERGEINTSKTFPSILSCFQYIRKTYSDKSQELDILVTGSIHLIGATIISLNELCKDLRDASS